MNSVTDARELQHQCSSTRSTFSTVCAVRNEQGVDYHNHVVLFKTCYDLGMCQFLARDSMIGIAHSFLWPDPCKTWMLKSTFDLLHTPIVSKYWISCPCSLDLNSRTPRTRKVHIFHSLLYNSYKRKRKIPCLRIITIP
jgi:hypothetical protein